MGYIVYWPSATTGNFYACRASNYPSVSYGCSVNIKDAQIYKTRVGAEKRATRLSELDYKFQGPPSRPWKVRKSTPKSS